MKQLCAVRYVIKNGKILIESKDDLKKRLVGSPDRAEAYIYGLYALRLAVKKIHNEWGEESDELAHFKDLADEYSGL